MKLKLNEDFCLGCKACEVACLDAHNQPSKAFLQIEEQTKMQEEAVVVTHRLHTCLQCEDPRCLQSCPQYAIVKREDGAVIVLEERCDGCGRCVLSCPTSSITLRKRMDGFKATKCDFCGGQPRCVAACPYQALEKV